MLFRSDDAADATAESIKTAHQALTQEPDMSPGLKIVQISITYYRAITFVGWLWRVSGDEYKLAPGARIVLRKSGVAWSWNGVHEMAEQGPGERYGLSDEFKAPEELHRLLIRRSVPCNEKAWAKHCPRPKDWVEG